MEHSWHARPLEDIYQDTHSSPQGLEESAVLSARARFGENVLPAEQSYSKARLFLRQFNSPLIAILIIAGGISLALGHIQDALFIIVVLSINTSVGFYQENKANASLKALKHMVRARARVLRDGNKREVDGAELVPGDIVYLKAGDKVPADARIVQSQGLSINESSLTGEWLAVAKEAGELAPETPLAERTNCVHMGSVVEDGIATVLVVATATDTALGTIVSLLKETRERLTPLQEKIAGLSRLVGMFVLGVVSLVVLVGYVTEKSLADIVVAALALTVSAIPAGLLPAITVILTLGMRRILKEKGLVRRLVATETLGSVTVICTDKTGTLTEGNMQVSRILTGTRELLETDTDEPIVKASDAHSLDSHILALKAGVLSNEAFIENPDDEFHEWIVRGRPTERALLVAGTHAGLSKKMLEAEFPLIERVPFTSASKFSASLHKNERGGTSLYVLGAPEVLESRAINFHVDGKIEPLNSRTHTKLRSKLDELTASGLRVMACAHREFPASHTFSGPLSDAVEGLTLVGYIALKDPLRTDASDSIALTKRAGIRTVLITGDHRLTALSIAREVGIEAEAFTILEGIDLDRMSDEELVEKSNTISIYARVSPHHKLRIVEALQKNREVVAMVGDGVNDAPALKAADVGVAVGSGTDVAKEVADMVLLDDNFKTIVKAIEQGRVSFQNIRKVFVYLVADDFSELALFLFALSIGLPLPLLAAQILWINLVEDGFPDIALTTEQETTGVMDEKPRDPNESILNRPVKLWMTAIFFISGAAAILSFMLMLRATGSVEIARTFVFALMCVDSLALAFSVRSFRQSVLRKDIFSNRLLVGAVCISFGLLLLALYVPALQTLLSTVPLSLHAWLLIFGIVAIEMVLIEWSKKSLFGRASTNVKQA